MAASSLIQNTDNFRKALIGWYDANKRDLPWRKHPSLYGTVVSEFMLQQTQVKTVLPYYANWLESYPGFEALAAASEESVLKSWEGLGYYSRARNLHKLAKEIVALAKAELPTDAVSWLEFPGVGPYAAAAICSIAFQDRAAVVDGNVVRILARLTADESAYKNSSEAAKAFREIADSLLNPDRPGDHNQAMMELGATLCLKQKPQCLLCPVRSFCQGRQRGIEECLPNLAKTKFERQTIDRAWISGPLGLLIRQIPQDAKRMKGLHEIPTLAHLSLAKPIAEPLLERKRSITRYRITERFYRLDHSELPNPLPKNIRWAMPKEIEELPFSGPHRRWLKELIELAK